MNEPLHPCVARAKANWEKNRKPFLGPDGFPKSSSPPPQVENQAIICKHDPAHCLAPGLFRSLSPGERKSHKLDFTYRYGDETLEFKGAEPLGVDDLKVLQGLIAMAGEKGCILAPKEPGTREQLDLFLSPQWDAVEKDALVVRGSFRELAVLIGYKDCEGGATHKKILDCIKRLYATTVFIDKSGRFQGFRLIGVLAGDQKTGKLYVAINHRLTEAITGTRPYTRILLEEARKLKSDCARLIHQRLCAWVDPGLTRSVSIPTLSTYCFPLEAKNITTNRTRHSRVRHAMRELGALPGWTVTIDSGTYNITRPAISHA